MGVPGLYRNLLQIGNISKSLESYKEKANNLYLDANNIIHKAKEVILKNNNNNSNETLDSQIISETIRMIHEIILLINPSDKIFVSIDGVPPYAKTIQQYNRRFKSNIEREFIESIAKKYNTQVPNWDSSKISPGTQFMNNLQKCLLSELKTYKTKKRKVILSSYNNPGEGEFKIMKDIKDFGNYSSKSTTVIVSDDADLISLTLLIPPAMTHIYILRNGQKGKEIINLGIVRSTLAKLVQKPKISNNEIREIVFCLLICGDDFLPTGPTTDLKFSCLSALDKILKSYSLVKKEYPDTNFININKNKLSICKPIFMTFLKKLEVDELENLELRGNKILKNQINNSIDDTNLKELTAKEKFENELNQFRHTPLNSPNHPFYLKCGEKIVNSAEQITNPNSYYVHNVGLTDLKNINLVVENYLEMMLWTYKYMLDSIPPNYNNFYKYRAAPLLKDIVEYLDKPINLEINSESFKFPSPLNNLLYIVPFSSVDKIFNQELATIFKRIRTMETNTQLDCINGIKFIYSEVIMNLPDISILTEPLPDSDLNRVFKNNINIQ